MSFGNSITTTLIAIVIGVGCLIILTFLAVCTLPVVLNFVKPILPLCAYEYEGQTHPPGICDDSGGVYFQGLENVFWWLVGSLFAYCLNICISGFISGFYLNRSNLYSETRYWQALISGFFIGPIGPILFVILYPSDIKYGIISMVIASLTAALTALLGYYISGHWAIRKPAV